jgi:hypothetical protein
MEIIDELYDKDIDLDDIFQDETEEILFEFTYEIPVLKSAITRKIGFDINANMRLIDRKKNMDI